MSEFRWERLCRVCGRVVGRGEEHCKAPDECGGEQVDWFERYMEAQGRVCSLEQQLTDLAQGVADYSHLVTDLSRRKP